MFAKLGYYICIPFAWLVRLFYNLTGSYGVALILFTLVIKLVLLPFQMKSKKSMLRMSRMSGKMQEIQKKYANNQIKMQEEVAKLYEEEGVNPMSGCLWSFLPMPILLALYSIIRQPITHFMMLSQEVLQKIIDTVTAAGMDMSNIVQMTKTGEVMVKNGFTVLQPYGQINLAQAVASKMPEAAEGIKGWFNVNYNFLGLDLSTTPSSVFGDFHFEWAIVGLILIPILAGLSQIVMTKVSMSTQPNPNGAGSPKLMMYMMSLFSVYIAFVMPAALGIYWIAQSVFSLIQEVLMNKVFMTKLQAEEDAREAAIQSDRQRRMEEGRKKQAAIQNAQQHKKTLKEKQKEAHEAKAAKAKMKPRTNEAGRVGERPYARGRSYIADRYDREG